MTRTFSDAHEASDGLEGPTITRRQALAGGVAAAGSLTAAAAGAPVADAHRGRRSARAMLSFDADWRFFRGAVTEGQARAFDDSGWRKLDLPHDWSIEDLAGGSSDDDDGGATADPSHVQFFTDPSFSADAPRKVGPFDRDASPGQRSTGYAVGGEGWYRKHFRLRGLDEGERVELRFDGVYEHADVWLNGRHLGFHPYGYSVFAFDLTPHLRRDGDNVLAVRVRNLGRNSRWYSGSGIYRHTWLTVSGAVRVPLFGVGVTTPAVRRDRASVRTEIDVHNTLDHPAPTSVRVTIRDARGRHVAERRSPTKQIGAGARSSYTLELAVTRPRLWSLEDPHLYVAEIEVRRGGKVVDRVVETFGVRSIVLNPQVGFLLNGKSLEMRGANVHHDHGPLGAVALDRSEERRVELLKAAGFNTIRSAHNPANPALLEACDRLGMLVMDEFSDMWDWPKSPDDYSNFFEDWWPADLRSWVLSGRNHPSVVLRSIGNEIHGSAAPSPAAVAARGRELASAVRELDPTRPIVQGGAQGIAVLFPTGDLTADYLDLGDVHYQSDFSAKVAARPDWAWISSEDAAAQAYDIWKVVTDNAYAVGSFTWSAWDYLGEGGIGVPRLIPIGSGPEVVSTETGSDAILQVLGVWGPYPWYSGGVGDFDLIGQPRPQHRYRQVVWGDSRLELAVERPSLPDKQQQAYNFGWFDELPSWTWDVPAGQSMKVRAYTTGDKVKLFLNGQEVGARELTVADKLIAPFRLDYEPGTLTAVAYRNGREIARKSLRTVGAPAALRLRSDVARLTTSRNDLAHVLVEVVDAHGRRVPDAVVNVTFDVSGGVLVAVGNGNPHNVASFKQPNRYSYRGQAMAYVRPPRRPGHVVVRAQARGLRPATLVLRVKPGPAWAPPTASPGRSKQLGASLPGAPLALLGAAGFAELARRRERNHRRDEDHT